MINFIILLELLYLYYI